MFFAEIVSKSQDVTKVADGEQGNFCVPLWWNAHPSRKQHADLARSLNSFSANLLIHSVYVSNRSGISIANRNVHFLIYCESSHSVQYMDIELVTCLIAVTECLIKAT